MLAPFVPVFNVLHDHSCSPAPGVNVNHGLHVPRSTGTRHHHGVLLLDHLCRLGGINNRVCGLSYDTVCGVRKSLLKQLDSFVSRISLQPECGVEWIPGDLTSIVTRVEELQETWPS